MERHGEFQRIAEIARRLRMPSPDIALGIGDDAAVLAAVPDRQVLSVDAQVEGVHFARNLLTMNDIGYRAFVAAISDLAAMGARPRAALVALILPTELPESELYELIDGIADAQRNYGCPVVGGNLAAGSALSITTTVIGSASNSTLARSGCQVGDALYIAGELGSAALGLSLLQAGRSELGPHCVTRWRRPVARIDDALALLGLATGAIDVSDGLLQDTGHLAEASGVGFDIELERLPLHEELREAARALGIDSLTLAVSGGEDYGLLFTVPMSVSPPVGQRIGVATSSLGVRLIDDAGQQVTRTGDGGYDHFRRKT
jgi:thiamine-monophosphate kinase